MMQFEFTDAFEKNLETIDNLQQLKQILKRKSNQKTKSYFKFYFKENQYIYAYCSRCSARVRFIYDRQSQNYRLTFKSLQHRHSTNKNFEYQAISSFIQSLPNQIEQSQVKHLVINNFKIKESRFYYIYSRCKYPRHTYSQAVKFLEKNNCFIQSQPWEQQMNSLPDVLIVVSPAMKEQFQQFGQWLYFDTTYHIIRNRTEDGRQWKVGMFIGLNSARNIIPFGYCLILDETKENFSKVFRSFFEIMGKAPNTIITDESAAIKSSINELRNARDFIGEHFFDNFHILKNIKKRLKRKANIQYFINLMKANSLQKFQQLREQYYNQIEQENDLQLFSKFIKNSSDYCFACIPPVFIGTSVSDSPIQKANDLLKSKIKIERTFPTVMIEIYKFMQSLIKKSFNKFQIEKKMVQQYYCISELKYVRLIVCKPIFKALINQIKQIYLFESEQIGHNRWRVRDQDQLTFNVKLNQQNDELICSCQFRQKSGLPCAHLCKCIKACRKSIVPYIFSRWKREYIEDKSKFKIGRGKDTRRNRK